MNRSLIDHTFVVIDLETTGISRFDRICEIGMIRIEGNEIVDRFDSLINPGVSINNTVFHGIENWMVDDAPVFRGLSPLVVDFMEDKLVSFGMAM